MRTIPLTLVATVPDRKEVAGRYFRLMETGGPVDVNLLSLGRYVYEAKQVEAGFYATPEGGFDAFEITSASGQTIKVAVSLGGGGYDRSSGDVNATARNGNQGVNSAVSTVTNVQASAIAANAIARRLVLTADLANTADIILGGSSGSLTVANGAIILAPGDSYIADADSEGSFHAIAAVTGQTLRKYYSQR